MDGHNVRSYDPISGDDIEIVDGKRVTNKEITMISTVGSGAQNYNPAHANLAIKGANPPAISTVNVSWLKILHETAPMANLRLKCADWNVVVKKNVRDAYVFQGEIDYEANVAVSGESAVLGLVMRAHTGMIGFLRGIILSMEGALPAGAIGIEVRNSGDGTLAQGVSIDSSEASPITIGVHIGGTGGVVNAFSFPVAGTQPVVASVQAGEGEGSIRILVSGVAKYLKYWAAAAPP